VDVLDIKCSQLLVTMKILWGVSIFCSADCHYLCRPWDLFCEMAWYLQHRWRQQQVASSHYRWWNVKLQMLWQKVTVLYKYSTKDVPKHGQNSTCYLCYVFFTAGTVPVVGIPSTCWELPCEGIKLWQFSWYETCFWYSIFAYKTPLSPWCNTTFMPLLGQTGITFSTCPFVGLSIRPSNSARYCENELNDFEANRHKWSTGQELKWSTLAVGRSKVKAHVA